MELRACIRVNVCLLARPFAYAIAFRLFYISISCEAPPLPVEIKIVVVVIIVYKIYENAVPLGWRRPRSIRTRPFVRSGCCAMDADGWTQRWK